MKSVSRIETAPRVKARLADHAAWWRAHRKGSRWTFSKAVLATHAEIKRNPELGTAYDVDGFEGVRFMMTATDHALYYVVVDSEPKPYVAVVGVKGPWEATPYFVSGT